MAKKYKFVGKGGGVPGLPHEITDAEAEYLGVLEILQEAIKNGNYQEVKPEPKSGGKE